VSIDELIPTTLAPSPEQTDILLELAYLVTAVDGRLADEEIVAFETIATRLYRRTVSPPELDTLIERFAHNVEQAEIEARVRELVPALDKELHAAAYRLALGVAFVDHEPSVEEDALHKVLGDALGLTPEMRAALARQVALGGGKARAPGSPDPSDSD
jgi:uncharacterized tellurite resistance protein B-like protein